MSSRTIPKGAEYYDWLKTLTPEEREREYNRRLRMITIECTPEEAEEDAKAAKAARAAQPAGGKRLKNSIKDPVKFFHLTVKVDMKFRGKDAKAARRYIYDSLRRYTCMFAGFDGPREPIIMSFHCAAGNQVIDLLNTLLPPKNYEDLEISLHYEDEEKDEKGKLKDPEHRGDFKYGQRKKGLARGLASLFDFTKETETGQMKLL